MFSDELLKYDWDETTARIASKTAADVERALGKRRRDIDDFMALISPAAAPYLERMAAMSRALTQKRFGKVISMYIPMYITNSCTNSCVYCGFNCHNKFARVILTPEQIETECRAIRRLGPFENLLLVTGENPRAAGTDYLEQALRVCRPYFNNLTIEVMPLSAEDYERLTHSGLNGVVCFQETYHRERYKVYHPAGMKSNFEWRVNGFDRMGQAGVHKIGMGVLIGLEDWRTDVTQRGDDRPRAGAAHLRLPYLRRGCGHIRVDARVPGVPQPHSHPRCHQHERRLQDRARRLRDLPAGPRAVRRQRRAHAGRGGRCLAQGRLRSGVEGLGQSV